MGHLEPRKTHPPLLGWATWLRGLQPPGAVRRKLCAALQSAPGTRRRCSRAAPPPAALPAAACSTANEERPGGRAGGAAATFSPPPLEGVRRAEVALLAPKPTAPAEPNTLELVCRVEV